MKFIAFFNLQYNIQVNETQYYVHTKFLKLHMLKLQVNLNFFVKIVTGFNTTGVFMTGKNMTYF